MMIANNELRRLLDERGIEWKEGSPNKTKWVHGGIEFVAVNAWPRNGGAKRLILHANLTPEQAVAVTLGGRMLTADDVRDAIERYSDASGGNGRDLHSWAYTAIADELNATLGRGECE